MALVMGITLPAGLDIVYNKTLKMYDISVLCNVGKNPRFFPRSRKMTLREITYLFQISYAWSFFTDAQKLAWKNAGAVHGENGYNLYVQDKSWRIKNGVAGDAVPSLFHQFQVGHISITAPSTSARIAQYNTTRVNFPATFQLSYKTNLTAVGADPYARLKFIWTRYYLGQNIENTEIIDIPLSAGWATAAQNIATDKGIRGKWRLELQLNDVQGDLWFDNIYVQYGGEIKLNDPFCDDVEKWWKAEYMPTGSTLSTIYPQGGAL